MTADALDQESPDRPPFPRAGVAVALACLGLGVISALEMRHMAVTHGDHAAFAGMLHVAMPRWFLLAATLPFVLRVGLGPDAPRLSTRTALLHVALFLAISWAHAVVVTWSTSLTCPMCHLFPWESRVTRSWYGTLPTVAALYGAVLLAAWAMAEARERQRRTLRASQLEAQLQASRLEALRAKLQPHFLYNTLTGIAALVADARRDRAVAAIEQLAELLHASLRDDARAEVPVAEEVALAEKYLALQRMRFGERLRYTLAVDPAVADCQVPVLLLQPIVENAVVHGLDAGAERICVAIAARPAAEGLELVVRNDGASLGAASARASARAGARAGTGVGLAATRARLLTTYGDRASLRLVADEDGGVTVRIALPRTEAAPDGARRSTTAFAEAT